MKPALLLSLIASTATLSAQTPAPAAAPTPPAAEAPKLTEAQVNNVLSQLKELEKSIVAQRGSYLAGVIDKLQKAAASDEAAMNFYLDCYTLITTERKEGTKMAARDLEQRMEKQMERKNKGPNSTAEDEGDQARAIRLGIRYLMLTLEAHECPEDELARMIPKLQDYIKDLVDSGSKLKGRALNMMRGGTAPIIEAYKLGRYLQAKDWSQNPADIGGIYQNTIFKLAEKSPDANLAALWDGRIAAEQAFHKSQLPGPEFDLWVAHEFPTLRWMRASHLYKKSTNKITAMADMLTVIKEYPAHADAPDWVEELRTSVNESSAVPPSEAATGSN